VSVPSTSTSGKVVGALFVACAAAVMIAATVRLVAWLWP
jgi:hypothetical protein